LGIIKPLPENIGKRLGIDYESEWFRAGLPYAGITRIRFKGFSCEFSVLNSTPPASIYLYHCPAKSPTRTRSRGDSAVHQVVFLNFVAFSPKKLWTTMKWRLRTDARSRIIIKGL
jgi:hypothetical protein